MMKVKFQRSRATKIEFRCVKCRDTYPAKDGDWHPARNADSQEIFLCRRCEKDLGLASKSFTTSRF